MSTCSYSSRNGQRNTRCWSRHNSRSVAYGCILRLTWRKGRHCCSSPQKARPSFLPRIVCLSSSTLLCPLHVESPQHLRFENDTWKSTHKGFSGVSASAAENSLSFLFYNASRCRNGRCGWGAGRNDRSIRVEIGGLLAKVLTSNTMVDQ